MYDTTPAAELFVARVADLITPAEATRMRASLEIDLHMGAAHAVDRAMRGLERQRLGYRSSMSRREIEALEEIGRVIRKAPVTAPQPVRANAHTAPAASAAERMTSWFSTAHIATAPLMFRTRTESPVL